MNILKKIMVSFTAFAMVLTSVPAVFAVPDNATITVTNLEDLPEFVSNGDVQISVSYEDLDLGEGEFNGLPDGWTVAVFNVNGDESTELGTFTNADQNEDGNIELTLGADVLGRVNVFLRDEEGQKRGSELFDVFRPLRFDLSTTTIQENNNEEIVVTVVYTDGNEEVEMYSLDTNSLIMVYNGENGDENNPTDFFARPNNDISGINPNNVNDGTFSVVPLGEPGFYTIDMFDAGHKDYSHSETFEMVEETIVEEEEEQGSSRRRRVRRDDNEDQEEVVEEEVVEEEEVVVEEVNGGNNGGGNGEVVLEGQSNEGESPVFNCIDLAEDHWAYEMIHEMIGMNAYFVFDETATVNMSLETGFNLSDAPHTCRPEEEMTRAEFTALLVHLYLADEFAAFMADENSSFEHPYVDLEEGDEYFNEVVFATHKGIVVGVVQATPGQKDAVFARNQVIKRSEALKVALLSQGKFDRSPEQRAAVRNDYLMTALAGLYDGDKEEYMFNDVFIDEIYEDAWYRDLLEYAVSVDIIEGRMIDMGEGKVERRAAMADGVKISEAAKILKTVMDHTSPFEVVAEEEEVVEEETVEEEGVVSEEETVAEEEVASEEQAV